jgi:hypothetical protein
MEEQFRNWLHRRGNPGAAISYPGAIRQISEHYSEQTGSHIDIYAITEHHRVSEIAGDYSQGGRFAAFGYRQNGRFRAAILRYAEFFSDIPVPDPVHTEPPTDGTSDNDGSGSVDENFAYERDLQRVLCAQVPVLFPGYRIFGDGSQGIEYPLGPRRVDVLLEDANGGGLLVVELKAGIADYRAFGQICMYVGLLREQFPERDIRGAIVAGGIDASLTQAAAITDRVTLKVYRMSVELNDP